MAGPGQAAEREQAVDPPPAIVRYRLTETRRALGLRQPAQP